MNVLTLLFMQVALEYAQKKYDDFAAIVQPFFSKAQSDNFTVDFLSDVSLTIHILLLSYICILGLPIRLLPC